MIKNILTLLFIGFLSLHIGFAQQSIDLRISSINHPIPNKCYGTNELVEVQLSTRSTPVDFTIDTTIITVDLLYNGTPIQNFTYILNDNSLNNGQPMGTYSSLNVPIGNIDMSNYGQYKITSYIFAKNDVWNFDDTLRAVIKHGIASTKFNIRGTDTICGPAFVELKAIDSVYQYEDVYPIQWQRLVGGSFIDIPGEDDPVISSMKIGSNSSFRTIKCGVISSDTFNIVSIPKPSQSLVPNNDSAYVICGKSAKLNLSVSATNPNKKYKWFDKAYGGNSIEVGGNIEYISASGDSLKYNSTSHLNGNEKIDTFYVEEVIPLISSPVLITDVSMGDPDMFEIQNISGNAINLNGWKIIIGSNFHIDSVVNNYYPIDTVLGAAEYLSISEWAKTNFLHWVVNINWTSRGWILLLDNNNTIADAVFMGWDSTDINNSNIKFNGKKLNISNHWSGDGIGIGLFSPVFRRIGNTDNNNKNDFIQYNYNFNSSSFQGSHYGLTIPFQNATCKTTRTPVVGKVSCINADDLAITALSQPIVGNQRCATTSSEVVEVSITNSGSNEIDFTIQNLDVTVNVTGPITQTLNVLINNNSLNNGLALSPYSSMQIPMGNIDMTQIGNYNFEAYFTISGDSVTLNDTIRTQVSNVLSGGTLTATKDTVCNGENIILSTLNSVGTLQWQRLVNGVFTDEVGADSISFEVFIDSLTHFRVATCGNVFSDTLTIYNFNIAPPTTKGASKKDCGPISSVFLHAYSSSPNVVFKWYENLNSKIAIHTGDSLEHFYHTTSFPSIKRDTFYVSAQDTLSGCESARVPVNAKFEIIGDYPNVNLGSDTTVCLYPPFILDAGIASSYQWNKGTNFRYLKPLLNEDSLYVVTAESSVGCIKTDSIVVIVDSCIGKGGNYYYLKENFNHGIPTSWTNSAVSGSFSWMHGKMDDLTDNIMDVSLDRSPMVYFNDDSLGYINNGNSHNDNTAELLTPFIHTLPNYPLYIEFDFNFRRYNASNYFSVELYDGNSWDTLLNVKTNSCGKWGGVCVPPHFFLDISSHAGKNIQLKFTYHDGNDWSYWAAFDNVEVYNPVPYNPIGDMNGVDTNGVADSLNKEVWITGTVAGIDLEGNDSLSFTLIDQVSGLPEGINVHSNQTISNYIVTEYDSINIIGKIVQTNGLQQIVPDSIFIIANGKALPIATKVITLNENTESQIIELTDLTVLSIDTGSSFEIEVLKGNDTLIMYIDEATDVDNNLNFNVGDVICKIEGIGYQNDSTAPYTEGYSILPMYSNDIKFNRTIDLGADTIVCDITNFYIIADSGFVSYLWNTGDTTQSIQPSMAFDSLYIVTAMDSNGCYATDSIIVDICTGIDQLVNFHKLTIQPNPSKGIFEINGRRNTSGETIITIYNSYGKIIKELEKISDKEFNEVVDLSNYAKGVYYIKLESKRGFDIRKLIVQ